MGIWIRKNSRFYYMTIGGRNESTGVPHDAVSPAVRKANREAALEVYHARQTQRARQRVGLPIDSDETFLPHSAWYEEHHIAKHRPSGADRERAILKHLRAHFGTMRLAEIKPARWTEYETKRLNAGVVRNTVGRELALMKSILNTAVSGELLELNPLAGVKRKTDKGVAKFTINKADEDRLLNEITDAEIRDIYLVAVGTLLRESDVIELRRHQFQRSPHGSMRIVTQTKTGPHTIDLAGPTLLQRRVVDALNGRLPSQAHGLFFPTWAARFAKRDKSGNSRAGNSKFLQSVRRACKRADIPWGLEHGGVVWHTLTRASGATRLLHEHGLDVRTVQLLGNWSSLDQMQEYLGLDLSKVHAVPTRPRLVKQGGSE